MGRNHTTEIQSPCLWAEKKPVAMAGRGTAGQGARWRSRSSSHHLLYSNADHNSLNPTVKSTALSRSLVNSCSPDWQVQRRPPRLRSNMKTLTLQASWYPSRRQEKHRPPHPDTVPPPPADRTGNSGQTHGCSWESLTQRDSAHWQYRGPLPSVLGSSQNRTRGGAFSCLLTTRTENCATVCNTQKPKTNRVRQNPSS